MPGRAQGTRVAKLFAMRAFALTGSLTFLAFSLACMSIQIGGRSETTTLEEGTGLQSGTVKIPAGGDMDVYYPIPYAGPPNLTTETTWNDCTVVEQKADHFRVHNPSSFSREVTWRARGMKINAHTSTSTV